jgi:hypothetical protein
MMFGLETKYSLDPGQWAKEDPKNRRDQNANRLEADQLITHSSFACCLVGRLMLALRAPICFISVKRLMARLFP